jgi:hypothetical protein
MTAATGISQEICILAAACRRLVPRATGLFWASIALISLAAFKVAQVRLQPDAIATGGPGFLWRLVLQPLELVMRGVVSVDPAALALQGGVLIVISGVLAGRKHASAPVPGEGLQGVMSAR